MHEQCLRVQYINSCANLDGALVNSGAVGCFASLDGESAMRPGGGDEVYGAREADTDKQKGSSCCAAGAADAPPSSQLVSRTKPCDDNEHFFGRCVVCVRGPEAT